MTPASTPEIMGFTTVAPIRPLDPQRTVLTDGVVVLRPVRESDADDVYASVRESLSEMIAWLPWAHADYTREESVSWLSLCADHWRTGREYSFAIGDATDGSFCGAVGLNHFDHDTHRANLGYWVRASKSGRGMATRAARLLAPWGTDVLNLQRIEIVAAVGNTRSVRAAEKTGALREGILRRRLRVHGNQFDAVVFSFVKGDFCQPTE
ncbi:MAG: GNAT family N-acetyltransferase [Pirellulales bacterium]|nr:GNAT family N-acetyltransferase [Pirellulales bacterium]